MSNDNIVELKPNVSPEVQAELEKLRSENYRLKTKGQGQRIGETHMSLKVSQKGACSLYGIGRFPATLYKEQWVAILDNEQEIRQFLADHDAELKSKKA